MPRLTKYIAVKNEENTLMGIISIGMSEEGVFDIAETGDKLATLLEEHYDAEVEARITKETIEKVLESLPQEIEINIGEEEQDAFTEKIELSETWLY